MVRPKLGPLRRETAGLASELAVGNDRKTGVGDDFKAFELSG